MLVHFLETLFAVGLGYGVVWILELDPLEPYVIYCLALVLVVQLFHLDRSTRPWRLRFRWNVGRGGGETKRTV